MITITATQWQLIQLLLTGAVKAAKLVVKALDNVKRVRGMSDAEVAAAIEKEEARSADLDAKLDAH